MLNQVEILTAKYGKPSKTTEQVTNGFGAKFDNKIYTWSDSFGTKITVESMYLEADRGHIVINSGSFLSTKNAAEKSLIKDGKENL